MIITIDGPAGSGKSTVAQAVAQELGLYYLNTGLLYRTVAYLIFFAPAALCKGITVESCVITERELNNLPPIDYSYTADGAKVVVNGDDITAHLFGNQGIDQVASKISALPVIRNFLLDVQRNVALAHSVIADGRDCGTVVFPNADFKFYLTADAQVRASRRMKDKKTVALKLTFEEILADVIARDERDKTREIAPLVVPQNAIVLDSSEMNIAGVVKKIIAAVNERS